MIDVIQVEQQAPPSSVQVCVQKDTADFILDMQKKVIYFTIVTCEGEMMYTGVDIQSLVNAAMKRGADRNKPKESDI